MPVTPRNWRRRPSKKLRKLAELHDAPCPAMFGRGSSAVLVPNGKRPKPDDPERREPPKEK